MIYGSDIKSVFRRRKRQKTGRIEENELQEEYDDESGMVFGPII